MKNTDERMIQLYQQRIAGHKHEINYSEGRWCSKRDTSAFAYNAEYRIKKETVRIGNREVKMVAAKDLKEGMAMDWEGDIYADPNSDNVLFANEYQEVYTTEQETEDCIKVVSGADNACGFPPEHLIKIVAKV